MQPHTTLTLAPPCGILALIMMTKDYLTELLTMYWFAPPVALWRAVELRVAAEETYARPMLDLGCGDGLIARVLFGTQNPIEVGFDPWRDQLRQAAGSGLYQHLDLAYGDHMPYPSGTFATVFSNSVLEHIPDIAPVVREAGRVLRPGGRFIFTVPSDAFRTLLDGYQRAMDAGQPQQAEHYATGIDTWLEHHHYHTPEQWRRLLAAGHMTMVKARYYIPESVERLWDRMNHRYGVNRPRSLWGWLASPRLRALGYQRLLRTVIVRWLSQRWRPFYNMDVPPGTYGGGLLIVAERTAY